MVKGKTRTGFEFQYDETVIDDMEFLELAASVENDVTKMPRLLNSVLGEDQKRRLYEHVRGEDGRVPTQAISDEMEDIFAAAGDQAKNS